MSDEFAELSLPVLSGRLPTHYSLLITHHSSLLTLLRIEWRAQVAFAEVGEDGDDELAGAVGAVADLEGCPDGGAGADAGQDAFLPGKPPGHGKGVVVIDQD